MVKTCLISTKAELFFTFPKLKVLRAGPKKRPCLIFFETGGKNWKNKQIASMVNICFFCSIFWASYVLADGMPFKNGRYDGAATEFTLSVAQLAQIGKTRTLTLTNKQKKTLTIFLNNKLFSRASNKNIYQIIYNPFFILTKVV